MKGRYRVSVSHIILICLFLNAYFGLVTAPQPSTSTLTTEATSTSTIKPTQPPTTTAPAPTTPPPSPTTTAATTTTPPPTTTAAPTTTSPPPTTTEAATTAPPPKTTTAATITAAPTNTTVPKSTTSISTNNSTNETSTVSSGTTPSTAASTPTPPTTSTTSTTKPSTPTTLSTTSSTTSSTTTSTTTTAPTTTSGNTSITSQTTPPETITLSTAQSSSPVTPTLSTVSTNGSTATLSSSSPTTLSSSSVTSASTVASNATQLTSTTTSLEQTTTGSSSNVPTTSLPATTSNELVATSTTTVKLENQTTTTSAENGTSSSTEQTTSSTTTGITSSTTSQSTSQQTTSNTLSTTQSVQTTTADPCDSLVCANNGICDLENSTATCICVPGYAGVNCSTNIDECEGGPCNNGGTCHDGIDEFTCDCPPGFNGTLCENNIDDCLGDPCKNGANCTDLVNSYECHCEAGYTGQNCTVDINDCVGEKCFNNGTCIDQVNNFTCTCTTGWKGHDCSENINECEEKTHTCNRNANCTDTEGGYNCTCWEGFTGNGYMCDDINECLSNSTVCSNNATCVNTPGDHRCVCAPGWTGDTCSDDINECKVASACASNSNCTNTDGSYTCKCKDGYRGDGYHKCIEEVLIAVDVGHTESGDDEIFGPYHVNKDLSLFGRMYNKFYVSINGYITLGNVINETYPPATSSGWDRFEAPIIAPLWADIEIHGTNGGVEIKNELSGKDLENIAKHLQVNSIRTGIVVTWKRAVPYPYTQNANFEAADFQVVIGATESNTYVIFNYDQEIFTWRTFSDRIVAAGYYFNDKNKLMTLDSNNFTSANMMNYDSSIKGRWIFNATSPSVEWKAKLACLAALNTMETNIESSEPCPCSEAQALRDTRFKFEGNKTIKGITVQQYVPRFKQPNERRQLCHYSSQYGSLIKGYPGGGFLETVNVTNAYKLCCNNSENISCNVFYQTSPSDNCSSYLPPTWSLSWGDPHFTTLDGKNYTFNGRGEYTLLSLDDASQSVKVQVRTEHIDDRKSATIFTGLAAQEVGKTKIELLLMNRTLKTANLYINNVLNTTFSSSKVLNLDFDDGSITSSNATISIIFKSGLTIRVGVSDVLNIVTSVPKGERFKGKTSGLLGNNNGISTDDFIKKNGTVLPAGSNETTLYSFGQSWMLTKNESLFGYYNSSTSGRNFTFFNDPAKAKPVTFIADAANFTDILITNCNKTHGLNLTHCKGNKACIVDTIGSCQKDFGEMSLDTEENAIKEKELIDNMPPDLEIPNELYVGYSKNTSVELKFKQQSVVQVTCKTNIESKSYKCDNTMFSWNVSQSLRNSMVDLTIMAKDSLNAYSEYQPNIYYCGCEKADQCDYSLIQIDGPVNESHQISDNFFRARCVCPETQNGIYCEKKVNICDRNPCFENVTCNSTLDNPCGPCPAGLTGDGVKCYDIDECRTHQSNCEQICNNTIGGFTCSCMGGYEVDGNTCKDIDECSSNTSYCDSRKNTYCVNTIGSSDCLCMPGFTENGGKCVNVKEKHSYGGVLVFEATPSVSTEELKKHMIDYLTSIFNKSGSISTSGSVYFVELVSFVVLPSSRKKRDTTSFNKYEMDYIVHMNQSVPTENLTATLDNTFNNLGQENGFVSPKIPGLNAVVKISTKDSKIFSDKDGGICKMPGSVTCDDISTRCVSANGTYSCICREGFSGWANPYTSCKDIDECSPKPSTVCIGGKNCTNYPGSYLCHCEPGFRYEKPNCVDMCDSSPCQNGGRCIHGNTEGMYLCKCDDKWTGPNCENENSEAEKLKIIAIAVGASVGGVCLLLLCGLCGMYRRYRNRYSGYRRRPLSSMDFDSSLGLAGTNIRTKDFPIDDDTDTAFSIPRPKYNDNEYDMLRTNASSLNETSGKDTGKVEEQENQLPKVTKETSAYGNDNPSFLHSEDMEAARRSSKRSSKNAYDYF